MLSVEAIDLFYGASHALRRVSLSAKKGEVTCVLGRNGVGKTSLLRAIFGLHPIRAGRISWEGQILNDLPPHQRARAGLALVPQGREIFPRLTVLENLMLGAFTRTDKDGVAEDLERVMELFPRLGERQRQRGGTLSGGEQQMLAIARALMSRPRFLCMDEPSMGLAPVLVEQQFDEIQRIRERGITVFVVEQNAAMALAVADRGYVLQSGRVVLSGTAQQLLDNPQMKRAYLGV